MSMTGRRPFLREEYEQAVRELKEVIKPNSEVLCVLINKPKNGDSKDWLVLIQNDTGILDITELLAATRSFDLVPSAAHCHSIRVYGGQNYVANFLSYLCFETSGRVTAKIIGQSTCA